MKRLLALALVAALGGCTLENQKPPEWLGPSGLGLSLSVTATPDAIAQDGVSQALVRVRALDAANAPVAGLTLRAEVVLGTVLVSGTNITTDNDGRAQVVFNAPPPDVPTPTATILVTPVGDNYANAQPRSVQIRLY